MSKALRVLLIEDSEDDAELILQQLQRHGYELAYLRVDNSDAMSTALEQQLWDVVLADYSLPKFSATAALSLLQLKEQDLPFIIVSGCIGDEIAVAAMKAGAHDYLMKHNLARLVPAVEREIQEASLRRERQRIQLELQDSEDLWQLALRGNNDGIWDWNMNAHEVFFSARWKEMLGYEEHEISHQLNEWLQRIHPDDLLWVISTMRDHVSQKTQFYRTEHRLRCKDGSYKWILSRGQAIWDEAGHPKRMVGSHTDITPTKELEVALRQQAESLAEANRLKDEFLAIVSHELRTPLHPILGWSQTLLNQKVDKNQLRRGLENIERSAKLLKQIIDNLLDVSQIARGKLNMKFSSIDLTSLVEGIVATSQTTAIAKDIRLEFIPAMSAGEESELEIISILGDANRLQYAIGNILSNAIAFTPAGGRVQIRLSEIIDRQSSDRSRKHQSPTDDRLPNISYAQIQISDTGIGISPQFLPHVFDRFRQEHSSRTRVHGGLGVGLAIARHIVESHGGTIRAESPGKDKGATFIVQLPLLDRGDLKSAPDSAIEPQLHLHS